MGDGAEDAFERDFHDQFGEDEFEEITSVRQPELNLLEFKEIKVETDKAWLMVMSGGAERWLPKSQCSIVDKTFVHVPLWLERKILFG